MKIVNYMGHASKRAIRENWCRPLIRFIRDSLGYRLTYLGLPSPEAQDILCWIEYVDRVIAFQCRDYPNPSSVQQSRQRVRQLEAKLMQLERQGKLSTFALYDGYIEEVLIKGMDTTGKEYKQDDVVTIYNLDFCNGITFPLEYYDENNDKCRVFKSEAIRNLLEWQRRTSLRYGITKFVMFLTIHSGFFRNEEERFLRQEQDHDLKNYLDTIAKSLRGRELERRLRSLKTYVYQIMRNFFCTLEFSPEFLPVIYYPGSDKRYWLVHFTVIGVFNRNPSSIAPCFQTAHSFLNQRFLHIVGNRELRSRNTIGISEEDVVANSVSVFESSRIFQELWS